MQIDLDDPNDAYAADRATGGVTIGTPLANLTTGNPFGEDALAPPATLPLYLQQINPNLVVCGGFVLAGIFALNLLVAGLGNANPNNQMLQSQQVTAEANGTALTATTDALKTVANQRPSCIAILGVCNAPDQTSEPVQQTPAELPPLYPDFYPDQYLDQSPDQFPNHSLPAQSATLTVTVPTNASTPDFWRYQWQQDPAYVYEWIRYCQSQGSPYSPGWQSPECRALSSLLH
jgi:hypothetical protein